MVRFDPKGGSALYRTCSERKWNLAVRSQAERSSRCTAANAMRRCLVPRAGFAALPFENPPLQKAATRELRAMSSMMTSGGSSDGARRHGDRRDAPYAPQVEKVRGALVRVRDRGAPNCERDHDRLSVAAIGRLGKFGAGSRPAKMALHHVIGRGNAKICVQAGRPQGGHAT